jgi:hypothetical protein
MTTYQGVAAVTQTLVYLLGDVVRRAVPEAEVTTQRPEQPAAGAADQPRVNVYLIQVAPDPTKRSHDLPTRTAEGQLLATPQAPLNLRYLLSYFGPSLPAQLMLGAVEVALRENAVLTSAVIERAVDGTPELRGNGLAAQLPPVRLTPVAVSLEELSRFWSGFFQMPYTLSSVYEASAAILTSSTEPAAAVPATKLNVLNTGSPR